MMNQPTFACDKKAIKLFLNGEMSVKEQNSFELHLDQCDQCCEKLRRQTAEDSQWQSVANCLSGTLDLAATQPAVSTDFDTELDFLSPTDDPYMLGRFGGYEIAGVIGVGGMGIVLKGFDRALNRFVAIKVLLPHYASSATARKRFAREARAAAAVVHENVVAIHAVSANAAESQSADSDDGDMRQLPYLVMPYLSGESLQRRIDREGALSTEEILRISIQVAEGLSAAHDQGLVHRDIKPANILLPQGVERVKLTDFGLARAADDASLTRTGVIAGTPQYMSPEQAQGETLTVHSDLFSLGSVMYTMCTGRPPFRAETPLGVIRRIVDQYPRPIQEINSKIPYWLCEIVAQLQCKNRDERPSRANEVAHLLKECLAHAQQPNVVSLPAVAFGKPLRTSFPRDAKSLSYYLYPGVFALITTLSIVLLGSMFWPTAEQPSDNSAPFASSKALIQAGEAADSFARETVHSFSSPDQVGELQVDIKRGDIYVSSHEGENVIVRLKVPNYQPKAKKSAGGLSPIRGNNLDLDISESGNVIKVDANSESYVTNLEILVPRNVNLTLDSYRNGVIKVEGVNGKLNLRSQNNDISMTGVSGSARAWSYNGSIVASFDSVDVDRSLHFESYNGSVDVALPDDLGMSGRFRTGTGQFLTDFDIQIQQEKFKRTTNKNGGVNYQFDEFVNGEINGGGLELTIETEKGDIRLRERNVSQELQQRIQAMDPNQRASDTASSKTSQGALDLASRQKTFDDIAAFVAKDQMPAYLKYAAQAGLLELQREQAIKQLAFEQAYQREAELILVYEKAIQSYEAMMDDKSWQKRFPEMDLDDTKPYRRRLDFLNSELVKRKKRKAEKSVSGN